jgi:hypothetical protein
VTQHRRVSRAETAIAADRPKLHMQRMPHRNHNQGTNLSGSLLVGSKG